MPPIMPPIPGALPPNEEAPPPPASSSLPEPAGEFVFGTAGNELSMIPSLDTTTQRPSNGLSESEIVAAFVLPLRGGQFKGVNFTGNIPVQKFRLGISAGTWII